MKSSALRKDFCMEIRKTLSRFISLMWIVALGVAFYSGIRSTEPDMNRTVDKMYDDTRFFDLRILSATGMTEEDREKIEEIDSISQAEGIFYMDAFACGGDVRYTVKISSLSDNIAKLNIVEGKEPVNSNECIVDKQFATNEGCKIGDTITIESGNDIPVEMAITKSEYTITGIYTTPYYLQLDKGTTSLGSGKINGLITICKDNFKQPVYNEVYATVKDAKGLVTRTKAYNELVQDAQDDVKEVFSSNKYFVLDRNSNQHYVEFGMDAGRIGDIGTVVPLIFFLVAALVSLTTMTRMVEEERTQIGTLKALGYGKFAISLKYILYALGATVTGSIIGAIAGSIIIPRIIINAYMIMYQNLGAIQAPMNMKHILTASVLAVVCVTLAAFVACYKELFTSAAGLMRPVAPKNGKRVFLERIPFLWNHMSFTWKSTVRNLLRYKKRFFMTVFGIAGSMGLIVLGFGIKNSISSIVGLQYNELRQYDNEFLAKSGMSQEQYSDMKEMLVNDKRISSVAMAHQSTMNASRDDETLGAYIFVPEDLEQIKDYVIIRDEKSGKILELNDESVVISKKMSILLDLSVGDSFELKPTETTSYTVKVGGICENYVYHYVYMTSKKYVELFGTEPEYNDILVKDSGVEYEEDDFAEDMLQSDYISSVNSIDTLRDKFDEMIQGMDIIIMVIIISAGGLAFVVLYNLNNINIGERIRELASLKVLGFYDGEVSAYVFRENMILTLVGVICGAIFGVWIHRYVIGVVEVDLVMFGRQIKAISFIISSIITFVFAFIINGLMHFRLKKIDMASSMKSVE